MPDPAAVNSMFARIARRYDLANRLLSFGIDRRWRKRLVTSVQQAKPLAVLDLATGSGDVAFALARELPPETSILGMDFCQPMLQEAEAKKKASGDTRCERVQFQPGDGMALPLADDSFDAITIAFGLRNMANRGKSLREMHRVLRPGGHLWVLEFSQPHPCFRPFYLFYLRRVLPTLAGAITGDRAAYVYLNQSIEAFPTRETLSREIISAGFATARAEALTLGIVALHTATR